MEIYYVVYNLITTNSLTTCQAGDNLTLNGIKS